MPPHLVIGLFLLLGLGDESNDVLPKNYLSIIDTLFTTKRTLIVVGDGQSHLRNFVSCQLRDWSYKGIQVILIN